MANLMEAGRSVEAGRSRQVLGAPHIERLGQFLSKLLQRDIQATPAGRNRDGHLESPP